MVRRFRPADRCRRADAARRCPVRKSRLGRVGATHPTTALGRALVLVQATPGAVLLGTGNGVVEALHPDRAARADLLGLALPDVPLWLPLAVWAEEKHQILATTRGSVLPTPVRAGKHGRLPTHLRHGSITSTKLLKSCVSLASKLACTRARACVVTAVASCNAERPHPVPARSSRARARFIRSRGPGGSVRGGTSCRQPEAGTRVTGACPTTRRLPAGHVNEAVLPAQWNRTRRLTVSRCQPGDP